MKLVSSHSRSFVVASIVLCSALGVLLALDHTKRASAPLVQADAGVSVWWPTNGVTVSGVTPVKGRIEGRAVESYKMFWRVGSDQKHEMPNNYETTPHKLYNLNLSGWTWKGSGPYEIIVSAEEHDGRLIGETRVSFSVDNGLPASGVQVETSQTTQTTQTNTDTTQADASREEIRKSSEKKMTAGVLQPATQTQTQTQTQTETRTSSPAPVPTPTGGLYVAAESNATKQAQQWRTSDPQKAALMDIMAKGAQSVWLGGWNADVKGDVQKVMAAAKAQGTTPSFVVYNIPHRDCGGYSAGGTASADAYRSWVRSIASGIGGGKALVVLEPDALTGASCLPESGQNERFQLLSEAVDTLRNAGQVSVYIDAGHARWLSSDQAATLLEKVNIKNAAGFSLNVSNFVSTDESYGYGEKISNALSGKIGKTPHFVIDTSRNGQGPGDTWCNPSGRGLGQMPTLSTGRALADAFLWVKAPGESDGSCNGAPNAGVWWPEYAVGLVERRSQ